MKQSIELEEARLRLEMREVNDEWTVLNEQCKRLLDAMAREDVESTRWAELMEMLSTVQAMRSETGDRYAALMKALLNVADAQLERLSGGVNAGAGTGCGVKGGAR